MKTSLPRCTKKPPAVSQSLDGLVTRCLTDLDPEHPQLRAIPGALAGKPALRAKPNRPPVPLIKSVGTEQ